MPSLLSQLGWEVPPPITITIGVRETRHTTTTKKNLQNLHIPSPNIHKLLLTNCDQTPHTYHPKQKEKKRKETSISSTRLHTY